MKIVTWNINSIRIRMELIQKLCSEINPDIICLQETKTEDITFPESELKKLGFNYIAYSGQKFYNGVAIISKIAISDYFCLDFYNQDKRHICARVDQFEIHNFYVPAGGDEPDININHKYKHKLEYIKLMEEWFTLNRRRHSNIILLGDLNIAPHENDVWSSRQLKNVISHTPPERDALIKLQTLCDFIDTGRHFTDHSQKLYTWWSYRNKDWQKSNRGRRLDHIWVSPAMQDKLISSTYLTHARNWLKPSDHVPCVIEINN